MKLAAIYNVWHDWDWLRLSVDNIDPLVDGVIIIASEKSNFGEHSSIPNDFHGKILLYTPVDGVPALLSETEKRNRGIVFARNAGYTHFLSIDCDEFYNRDEFNREKQRFIDNPDLAGLVCASRVYFKSPSLTIGLDTTRVPFIHKITDTLKHEFNRSYPFAWEGKQIRIDPTRSLNINSGVEWSPIVMEHYSWVRKDIDVKIRNSSARSNIERSTLRKDFALAKDGYYVEYYRKHLVRVPVQFNIPEFDVPDIPESTEPLASKASASPGDS